MLVDPVVGVVHHSMVVMVESVWLCCVVPNLMVVLKRVTQAHMPVFVDCLLKKDA